MMGDVVLMMYAITRSNSFEYRDKEERKRSKNGFPLAVESWETRKRTLVSAKRKEEMKGDGRWKRKCTIRKNLFAKLAGRTERGRPFAMAIKLLFCDDVNRY
jgi:hypothetical protein